MEEFECGRNEPMWALELSMVGDSVKLYVWQLNMAISPHVQMIEVLASTENWKLFRHWDVFFH